jgi:hypothetical protein
MRQSVADSARLTVVRDENSSILSSLNDYKTQDQNSPNISHVNTPLRSVNDYVLGTSFGKQKNQDFIMSVL